jgi:hypothetical protein
MAGLLFTSIGLFTAGRWFTRFGTSSLVLTILFIFAICFCTCCFRLALFSRFIFIRCNRSSGYQHKGNHAHEYFFHCIMIKDFRKCFHLIYAKTNSGGCQQSVLYPDWVFSFRLEIRLATVCSNPSLYKNLETAVYWHCEQPAKGLQPVVRSQSLLSVFLPEVFLSQPLLFTQHDSGTGGFTCSWQFTNSGCATRKSISIVSRYAVGFMQDKGIHPAG